MTYKDITDAIEEMKGEKLTDKTASIMADLLLIRDHWHKCESAREEKHTSLDDCLALDTAEAWCARMENADGTVGPHWPKERIQQELAQRGICCDLAEFWAVINAIYSDDCVVAKKHNVNTMDYYIDRAKAWLADKDAVSGKAAAYYCYIVKH